MSVLNKNIKSFIILGIVVMLAAIFFVNQNVVLGQENDILEEYNAEIEARKQKIDKIKDQIEEYNQQIKQKRAESISLRNQLAILENEMKKIELDIKRTKLEIESLDLEIKILEQQIKQAEDNIQRQKNYLSQYITIIYQNDQRSYLEILLLNDNFAEFFDQIEYLHQIQTDLQDALDKVQELKALLEERKKEMEDKKNASQDLMKELEERQEDLLERGNIKENLLIQTKRSEAEFKNLVYQLKLEQQQINAEISTLERRVREELAKREAQERFRNFGPAKFIWPVPSRYITSYFHDPDYPYRYIFEHPAIDIRATQGTPIKAAESGYVARAKDAGMGYSYIMIIHNQGFSTVYGHISKILVKEDEFVTQGQIIALSGGIPGTPGAGRLTSGPHLHFEVRLNGIPVNPLEYLP